MQRKHRYKQKESKCFLDEAGDESVSFLVLPEINFPSASQVVHGDVVKNFSLRFRAHHKMAPCPPGLSSNGQIIFCVFCTACKLHFL